MVNNINETWTRLSEYLPNLIGAILILIAGWLFALALAAVVRRILRGTALGKNLVKWMAGEEGGKEINIEKTGSKIVFYFVLVLVLVAFLQALGLTLATEPLNEMLSRVFAYIPRFVGAVLLVLVAWAVASIMGAVIRKLGSASKLDERLGGEDTKEAPVSQTLADVVYWLVIILFIPAIAGALDLQGFIEPVRNTVDRFLMYLPNLFGAVLIMLAGWIGARILQRLTVKFSSALGTDRLTEETGLKRIFGKENLSETLGLIAYVLVLIPVLIAALNALQLEAVTQPASNMLNLILQALPMIFAALLILTISYIIARVICGLATEILRGVGFDSLPAQVGIWREPKEGEKTPSEIAGWVALIVIMLFATIEAANVLGFSAIGQLIAELTVIIGHILFGLVIFTVGLWLASLAGRAIRSSELQQADLVATVAKAAILGLTGAVALRQMGLANEIIVLAFGLLLGSIAVAAAIAFGIGGRTVAAEKLEQWTREKVEKKESK